MITSFRRRKRSVVASSKPKKCSNQTWFFRSRSCRLIAMLAIIATMTSLASRVVVRAQSAQGNPLTLADPSGKISSFSTQGFIDTSGAFFQNLGTNGRTCNSCHVAAEGWTIIPPSLKARFDLTNGLDPVFNSFDGTNCPDADVSTLERRKTASSLLLAKGLIRIGLQVPGNAQFSVAVSSDPTGCALRNGVVSVYRRPLPSTNVSFLSTVMWDGRENAPGRSIHDNLISQANDATLGHAQASASPTPAQLEQIVAFQMALYTAQSKDNNAGPLTAIGAHGGPESLSTQNFFLGINDSLGLNPTGASFDPSAFTIYKPWLNLSNGADKYAAARQ